MSDSLQHLNASLILNRADAAGRDVTMMSCHVIGQFDVVKRRERTRDCI